jgi:protein-tyrosine-phosphatase
LLKTWIKLYGEYMPTILIVCTANICRSPMAMVLLEKKIAEEQVPGSWTVRSAGTWGRDGHSASKHGSDLMTTWGMDLTNHSSRVVNREILSEADLILTMEGGHKEALRAEFVDLANRVYMLSEMVGYPAEIRDPYGGTKEEYLETAEELRAYVNEGFDKIIHLANSNHQENN